MSFTVESSRKKTLAQSKPSPKNELVTTLVVTVIELGVISIGSYFLSKWIQSQLRRQQNGDGAEPHNASGTRKRLQSILNARAMQHKTEAMELPPLDNYEVVMAQDVVDPNDMDVYFKDVGGMNEIKRELWELAVLPLQRPDLFLSSSSSTLLRPTRGILLYGKPGTGKTMLAKAIAKEANATFVSVKLSKIMDKWFGESNKLISATFSLSEKLAPSIVFIDEIDTFLNPRDGLEGSASGAIKSEFLTLWDGLNTRVDQPVLVLGATNRPHNVDPAILRRLPRAFCIDLPNAQGRLQILTLLLHDVDMDHEAAEYVLELSKVTKGYSGSDLKELCRAAVFEPIREVMYETSQRAVMGETTETTTTTSEVKNGSEQIRKLSKHDLELGLAKVKRTGHEAYRYGASQEGHRRRQARTPQNPNSEMAQQQSHTLMKLLSNVQDYDDDEHDSEEEKDDDAMPSM